MKARRAWILVLALVLAAWTLERGWAAFLSRDLPTGDAEWIWAAEAEMGSPLAFLAVRDFLLDEPVVASRLLIEVDGEYQLYLDREWLGGGRFRLGDPVDVFELETLPAGAHRVLIEARSESGAGGILFSLQTQGSTLLVSDSSWSIFERADRGLIAGWSLLEAGQAPAVLGRPPIGRWRTPRLGSQPSLVVLEKRRFAIAQSPLLLPDPRGFSRPGTQIDFGDLIFGYLDLWSASDAVDPSQVRFAAEGASLESASPELAIWVNGRRRWRDVEPRRFRYAWIEGPAPEAAAVLVVNEQNPLEAGAEAPRRPTGPFGLSPPPPEYEMP